MKFIPMEAIESRFLSYWETTKSNSSPTFTASLRARKEFTNPYILERVVDKLKIDEYGTNFSTTSKRRHTPDEYVAEDFYLVLRELDAANASAMKKSQTLELVTSAGVKEEENNVHLDVGSDSRNGLFVFPASKHVERIEPPPLLSQHRRGEEESSTGQIKQKRSRWQ